MTMLRIKKWGNSLAVRLPKDAADTLGLVDGSSVSIQADGKEKVIKIIPRKKDNESLEDLLKKITKDNAHECVDWGKPRGREVW